MNKKKQNGSSVEDAIEEKSFSQYDRPTMIVRAVFAVLFCFVFIGLRYHYFSVREASPPYPEEAEIQITEQNVTNAELRRKIEANRRHYDYVTDVELAVYVGWLVTPILIVLCFVLRLPQGEDSVTKRPVQI